MPKVKMKLIQRQFWKGEGDGWTNIDEGKRL